MLSLTLRVIVPNRFQCCRRKDDSSYDIETGEIPIYRLLSMLYSLKRIGVQYSGMNQALGKQ